LGHRATKGRLVRKAQLALKELKAQLARKARKAR
jgi:hypothetical protein